MGASGETGARNGMTDSSTGRGNSVLQVPLAQLVDIHTTSGPPLIKNEDGSLTGWVYVDVTGRDIGGYVGDAKKAVNQKIEQAGLLPAGYRLEWTGQYEYMLRVRERLKVVVPLTLALIFVLLFLNFKSIAETFIILLSIPFAMTGSVWLLWLLGYNLSIAVWVGIIALAGLAAQTGTVMIIYLDEAFHAYQRAGRMKTQHDLFEAITYGAVQRVRPKLMTVCMITLGLVPALWAHGAGAEAIQRIAAPMVGGLITSTILTLEIVPAIYSLWRGRQVEWVKGPRPRKKSWTELSQEFVVMEQQGHHAGPTLTTVNQPITAQARREVAPKPRNGRLAKVTLVLVILTPIIGLLLFWKKGPDPSAQPSTTGTNHFGHRVVAGRIELTPDQRSAMTQFLKAADVASASLAADQLKDFNQAAAELWPAIEALATHFPPEHSWAPLIKNAQGQGKMAPAGDLAEARRAFLPFSTVLVEFLRVARQQDAGTQVKIFRCPMAPKPGFWMQLQGPLRNPYFGKEMLDCGSELP